MKTTIAFIILLLTVSCTKEDSKSGVNAIVLSSTDHFEVNYNGPWSGNYISNGNIYGITNYGSAKYSNYSGMAIRKNDITAQVLELKLVEVVVFDVGTNEYLKARKVTTGSNVLRIE